jgi:hypothetical protein
MPPDDSKDPLSKITGLLPRYVRERLAAQQSADAVSTSAAADAPPKQHVDDLLHAIRPVDAATADLRRRIIAAGPRRLQLGVAMPSFGAHRS